MKKRLLALITTLTLLLSLFSFGAFAALSETTITLDGNYNIAITVYYDVAEPSMFFTAPNGSIIMTSSLTSISGEGYVQYYIPNAQAGNWRISYDKGSNTKLDIYYSSYIEPLNIDKFEFSPIDNYLFTTFTVSSADTSSYEYAIYAVVKNGDGTIEGERLLDEGTSYPGISVLKNVYIDSLANYDNYYLRLDVERVVGVEHELKSKYADQTFSYSDGTVLDPIENFKAEVDLTESTISVDWSDYAKRNAEYTVAIFGDGASEPTANTTLENDTTYFDYNFDPSWKTITVSLIYNQNDTVSQEAKKVIPIDNGVKLTASASGLTSNRQLTVNYETKQSVTADIIFGETSNKLLLSGNGSFALSLEDGENTIRAEYCLSDELVKYITTFKVNADITPPTLILEENGKTLNVQVGTFLLVGKTEPSATLAIDGTAVTLNSDGTFSFELNVAEGENIYKLVSTDIAGNMTAKDVVINGTTSGAAGAVADGTTKSSNPILAYLPLIITFAAGAVFALAVVLTSRSFRKAAKGRKLHSAFKLASIWVGVLTCAVAGGYIYLLIHHNSLVKQTKTEEFLELVKTSIEDSHKLLARVAECEKWLNIALYALIGVGALFAILLIVAIITGIVSKKKGTLNNKAPKKSKVKTKTVTDTETLNENAKAEPVAYTEALNENAKAEQENEQPVNHYGETTRLDLFAQQMQNTDFETPQAEQAPATEEAPVIEEAPIVEEIPVIEQTPIAEEAPIIEGIPTVKQAPIVEEVPVVEEAPIVEEVPVIEQTPIVEEPPVIEEAPIIEEVPAVEETPIVEEAPVVEETPVVEEKPKQEVKFKFCPMCGTALKGTEKFCPKCGHRLI